MDNDEIRWKVVPGWQRAARLATANAPIEQVAPAAERSLYRTLTARDGSRGCPGLDELIRVAQQFWCAYQQVKSPCVVPDVSPAQRRALFTMLDTVEARQDDHKHTVLAADVVRRICINIGHGSLSFTGEDVLARHVAEAVCQRIVEHYLTGPLRPLMQGQLDLTYEQASQRLSTLMEAMTPFIAKTAEGLLEDNTGATVRRPDPRTSFKTSTAELLRVNLLG